MKINLQSAVLSMALAVLPLASQTALASPVITLNPSGGAIYGAPGSVAGWGFTVQSSPTEWVSFVTSFLLTETNPAFGFYTDFIGLNGGPVNFTLPAGDPDWVQSFNDFALTGIGSYTIDPGAAIGDSNAGLLRVLWASYSGDPNTCGDCFLDTFQQDLPFSVTNAPEPSTGLLLLSAVAMLALKRRAPR